LAPAEPAAAPPPAAAPVAPVGTNGSAPATAAAAAHA
jgi:hypothetical protein